MMLDQFDSLSYIFSFDVKDSPVLERYLREIKSDFPKISHALNPDYGLGLI